jgi:adhesin/invasin
MQPISPVTQAGLAGQAAGNPPMVAVRDALGNPVAGVTVTFSVTAGGGSLTGATVVTDNNGIAGVASWTFGAVAGLNTVVATSTGLASVTFNATTTGVPSQVVLFAGNNQAAVQGTAVQTAPSVRVTDVNGQGVGGVQVVFQVTAGGGNVVGGSPLTDVTGVARVGSWILGGGVLSALVAIVSCGVTGNPVTFTASAATQIAITQQPPAGTTSGTPFTVTVQLRDANGVLSPVNGFPLTISIFSGPAVVAGTGSP